MPTLNAKAFDTADYHIKYLFLWDTDSITFVFDKSATAIIFIQHKIFIGPLVPMLLTLDTA